VRVERAGIVLVDRGEVIGPAPDSEAELVPLDDQVVVHYHFPVEIEVAGAAEPVDADTVAERALWRLAEELRGA
jgi:hypothetical protein